MDKQVAPQQKYVETKLGPYTVHRYKRAISVKFDQKAGAKIDFKTRLLVSPPLLLMVVRLISSREALVCLVITTLARSWPVMVQTELNDPTEFALEWQVRDTEPMLFHESRFPQYPTQCTPPAKIMGNRLGRSHMEKVAEEACKGWKEDERADCIFDVIATRDVAMAADGDVAVVG